MSEICPLCWWEDDGLDDADDPAALDRISGPNHETLRQAREHFEAHRVTEVDGGRIVRGMNDPEAIENNRTIVWTLDALVDAPDAAAVDGMLILVDRALRENARDLMAGIEGVEGRFSADGYLVAEEDDWPKDRTGSRLRWLSERVDDLPSMKEGRETELVRKYWDDYSAMWNEDVNKMIDLEKLYRDDELSAPYREEYEAIKARFKAALPLIDELGLSRPPVPLD